MDGRTLVGNVGNRRSFDEMLKRAGINKAGLSRRFDMNPRSVIAWHDKPPRYATAYLELLIECNRWRP